MQELNQSIKEVQRETPKPIQEHVIQGPMSIDELIKDAQHSMSICNSCRYCEGFCAVFPAMEKRLDFTEGDIHYLANLCHNCSECYYACQYAPPHEFAVNIPQQLAQVRNATYQTYAWPKPIARGFEKSGLMLSLWFMVALAVLFGLASLAPNSSAPATAGDFYSIFPHNTLVTVFGLSALWVLIALYMGFKNFVGAVNETPSELLKGGNLKSALADALSMKYLHGNTKTGCTYPGDDISPWRRRFHHFTFYGFMLCFAATSAGTIMHYFFSLPAPYDFISPPKLLGTVGGISLMIGTAGQFLLKIKSDPNIRDNKRLGMDYAFIAQLFLAALTGLLLMVFRETAALKLLLIVHLAVILSLFITMPFGKFVHGFYRLGALMKYAKEEKHAQH